MVATPPQPIPSIEVAPGLPAGVVQAPHGARIVVVLLHGLGMSPHALTPFASTLGHDVVCCVPAGPVVHEDGSRSWWAVDMTKRRARLAAGPADLHDRHPEGRAAARAVLRSTLCALRAQWPSLPMVLAGFSQGGMLASDFILMEDDAPAMAGLALMSSTRIALDEWRARSARARGLPVLVAHGHDDDDLAFSAGEGLRDFFTAAQAQVQWLPFAGGHGLPIVVWRGLRRFLQPLRAP